MARWRLTGSSCTVGWIGPASKAWKAALALVTTQQLPTAVLLLLLELHNTWLGLLVISDTFSQPVL